MRIIFIILITIIYSSAVYSQGHQKGICYVDDATDLTTDLGNTHCQLVFVLGEDCIYEFSGGAWVQKGCLGAGTMGSGDSTALFDVFEQDNDGELVETVHLDSALWGPSGLNDHNYVFGSPRIELYPANDPDRNNYSRQFGWYDEKSCFWAGRVHRTSSYQWRPKELAQYAGQFGWNQFLYGGEGVTDGSRAKGQFSSGYVNRGFAPFAQTQGINNLNGSIAGTVNGNENYIGKQRYDFINYNDGAGTLEIVGDVTSEFIVNNFIAVRIFDPGNQYFTLGHAKLTSVAFNGTNTVLTVDVAETFGTEVTFTEGIVVNMNPDANGANGRYSHAIGSENYIYQEGGIAIGTLNEIAGDDTEFNTSLGYGSKAVTPYAINISGGFFENIGDAQTMILPLRSRDTKQSGTDTYRITPNGGSTSLVVPGNASWMVSLNVTVRSINDGATLDVGGFTVDFTAYRDGTGNVVILGGTPVEEWTNGSPPSWDALILGAGDKIVIEVTVDPGQEAKMYATMNISQVIE